MEGESFFALSLWNRGADEIFRRRYPLHRACRDGDVGFVVQSLMLDERVNLECFDGFLGWTPAHWAAFFGQVECLCRLVGNLIFVNILDQQQSLTLTHLAAAGSEPGCTKCLSWLLQHGANPNQTDCFGETAVHKAARIGNIDAITVLLRYNASLVLPNCEGLTPRALACNAGFYDCARFITERPVLCMVRRTKRLLDRTAFEMEGDRQHKMLAVTSTNKDNSDLGYVDCNEEVDMDTESEVHL